MIKKIPTTKKWIINYGGETLGDIVNSFRIDLFSSKEKIKSGKDLSLVYQSEPPVAFVKAKIKNENGLRVSKLWAASSDGVLRKDSAGWVKDESEGFFTDETIDDGSDLAVISDETNEPLKVMPLAIPDGETEVHLTGGGSSQKIAQSFTNVEGKASKFIFTLRKRGNPTDNIIINICADNNGIPGSSLKQLTINAVSLKSSFSKIIKDDFTDLNFNFEQKYWLVFERSGAEDKNNCAVILLNRNSEDQYPQGEVKRFNGVNWTIQKETQVEVVDTFTSNGTWTCPSNVSQIVVECWGGGGGGKANEGGGGGGAYSRKIITSPSGNYSVIVGSGGGVNANGGDSVFGSNLVLAQGGRSKDNGGIGGQASAGIGDVKYSGGNGSIGTGNRGGGGGAGDSANGENGNFEMQGFGGANNGGAGGGPSPYGTNDGRIIGGGGNSSSASGFAGARGEVRITYKTTPLPNYPFVVGRSFGRQVATTHIVSTPPGVKPNELLILIFSANGAPICSMPTGWKKISQHSYGSDITQAVFWKIAEGEENAIVSTSSSVGSSYIMLRIANGQNPTASFASGNTLQYDQQWGINPPLHTTDNVKKRLWIATGSMNVSTNRLTNVPPPNYSSFIVQPEMGMLTEIDARTLVAERYLEAASENPGSFHLNSAEEWVASTIAVDYKEDDDFCDISLALEIEIPGAEERLFLTTTKDIKFLDQENGLWRSLWQNILRQKPLDSNYPRILKVWGKNEVLFFANGHEISSIAKNAISSRYADIRRLVFASNYFVKWLVATKTAIFAGLENKISPALPSFVCYYDPFSEATRLIEIPEGTTIGFVENENCHIIDYSGQMRRFTGISFQVYDFLPVYFSEEGVKTLPHRNGFVLKSGNIYFLWRGQIPFASGIWIREGVVGRIYHTCSINNVQDGGVWKALFWDNEFYAGVAVGAETLNGIYSDGKLKAGWIKTAKMSSYNLEDNWNNVFIKGNINYLNFRSSKTETKGQGEWIASGKFTTTMELKKGQEITIVDGVGVGLSAFITDVNGNEITVDRKTDTEGEFTFEVENWNNLNIEKLSSGLSKSNLKGIQSDWIQLKVDFSELLELQISHIPSFITEES